MKAVQVTQIASRTVDDRASLQWAQRPADERFVSLEALSEHVRARRAVSTATDVQLGDLRVGAEGKALVVSRGHGARPISHWAFGQLCSAAGAPASYLRSLPAALAALPLQWSLEQAEDGGRTLLVRDGKIDAVTSQSYGRIWDAEVVDALSRIVGDSEDWKVPGASYASRDPKRATTLYASDRDVFVFLVNESNVIELEGERLFRGFYAWNSEVGSATFGVACFLYRYVCDNRMIWGQRQFTELRMKHTSGAPDRFAREVAPQLTAYAQSGTHEVTQHILAAKRKEVAKDEKAVLGWLAARGFTQSSARAAYAHAEREGLNPRSVWGLVQGLTEQAHGSKHTDDRVSLERRAGALLDF